MASLLAVWPMAESISDSAVCTGKVTSLKPRLDQFDPMAGPQHEFGDWRHAPRPGNLSRPFRACSHFNVIPRAMPWAEIWPPRWGFGMPCRCPHLQRVVHLGFGTVERLQEYRTTLITSRWRTSGWGNRRCPIPSPSPCRMYRWSPGATRLQRNCSCRWN